MSNRAVEPPTSTKTRAETSLAPVPDPFESPAIGSDDEYTKRADDRAGRLVASNQVVPAPALDAIATSAADAMTSRRVRMAAKVRVPTPSRQCETTRREALDGPEDQDEVAHRTDDARHSTHGGGCAIRLTAESAPTYGRPLDEHEPIHVPPDAVRASAGDVRGP